jgi:ribosomal protein S18 acetylase RimI-like enzyme
MSRDALAVSVRQAVAADADRLSAFAISTFHLGGPPETDPNDIAVFIASHLTAERFRSYLTDRNTGVFVADAESDIAGYAMLVRQKSHALLAQRDVAATSELSKFYVHPRFHGRGVSEALMRNAIEFARPSGRMIWLSVLSSNERALAFYRKWGFEIIGRQGMLVGKDLQDDFVMCRVSAT